MTAEEQRLQEFFTAIIIDDIVEVRETLSVYPEATGWLTPTEYPPLHLAILNHRPEIAVMLAEHGADLGQKAQGESAASMAARKGMLEILQEASARQDQCRAERIDNSMRGGLQKPIQVSSRPLSLKIPRPRLR